MPCSDSLPTTVAAVSAAIAQGKTDAELSLLAALFTQLGDSLALIAAARACEK